MYKQTHIGNPLYSFMPVEVEGFDSLAELALDMRWSWSHYADEVWRQLDPALWDLTQNPWVVLQTGSHPTKSPRAIGHQTRSLPNG